METILEVRRRPIGFGVRRQAWPKARHLIVNCGPVEARLIVPAGETVGFWGGLSAVVTGIILGLCR